jgi:hypothetical protein
MILEMIKSEISIINNCLHGFFVVITFIENRSREDRQEQWATEKRTQRQTMIDKTLHRKLKIEQYSLLLEY